MSGSSEILKQLKTQVLNLLKELLTIFPDDRDILFVTFYFQNKVTPEKLMAGFIKWVYPWKEHINRCDMKFFEDNDHIFGPLPSDKVNYFKVKMNDGTFDEDDKKVIWQYFQVFIYLIDKYKKEV